jgi:type II secretory pathway component GspD/PulD (secretin)
VERQRLERSKSPESEVVHFVKAVATLCVLMAWCQAFAQAQVKVFDLQHARAQSIARLLDDLERTAHEIAVRRAVAEAYLAPADEPFKVSWPEPTSVSSIDNLLIVRATPERLEEITSLLVVLDQDFEPVNNVDVYRLTHASAGSMGAVIEAVASHLSRGGSSVAVHAASNTIVVSSPKSLTPTIARIVGELDVEADEALGVLIELARERTPESLADMLMRLRAR